MRGLTIGRLAEAAGVHLETVRYYERIKLLPPPGRTSGGHRAYEESHIRLLAFIRRARELGFGTDDIRTLLTLAAPGYVLCAQVQEIAALHLESVRAKLADLIKLERILSETLAQCSGERTPICPILDMLGAPRDA
jgi:MerR family transcriptional regulator, mercuric resistance operon regulatory protein